MAGNYTICIGTIGTGVWLSPDGGQNWKRAGGELWNESRVFGLTVHPTESRTVFAGANDGIYKSTDGGATFSHLDTPMNELDVWRIAIDPVDPAIIYAGTRPAALYRSKDGGRNWHKMPAEIAESCPNVRIPRVTALTVDPSDHRVVWAGLEVDGVLRSSDGGDTWQRISTAGIPDPDIHDIAVTVNGSTTALVSTPREIFASTDRGQSWYPLMVGEQFKLGYCRHLAQKADDAATLFVATGNGAAGDKGAIQRSTNGGKSWQVAALPDEPNSPIWNFATHAADPGLIIACSHYGEIYASRDAGDRWSKLPREFTEIRGLAWVPN